MVKAARNPKADLMLTQDIGRFYADPLGFVMYAYPWDTERSIQLVQMPEPWCSRFDSEFGPDGWACEILDRLGEEIVERDFDGVHAVDAVQMGVASGHGIGKSAMTGWLVNFILSTRPHCQGTVTANTGPQLETKTWPQIVKWTKMCITAPWFLVSSGRHSMRIQHRDYPETWYVTAQTCREENSEAFAGQHAANSTSFYLFDEASAVPDKIWEVSDGGLTDGEPMRFVFGNPTRNVGQFYQIFHRRAHRWITKQIDSREVQITNKRYIQQMIDDEGEDSDYVKVRVKGQFPSASSLQLIPTKFCDEATKREPFYTFYDPIIVGVDVAREGDDQSVIRTRRGFDARSFPVIKAREKTGFELASMIAALNQQYIREYGQEIDAIFVDASGGWGWPVIDALRQVHKLVPIPVNFAGSASDKQYGNKRTEMYYRLREWLKEAGTIENDPQLIEQLTSVEYRQPENAKDQTFLQKKREIKKELGFSPDDADALALTFAEYVAPHIDHRGERGTGEQPEYSLWGDEA